MARCDKLEGGLVQVSVKERNNYVLVRTQAKKVFLEKLIYFRFIFLCGVNRHCTISQLFFRHGLTHIYTDLRLLW
jgi:hypothetical protein